MGYNKSRGYLPIGSSYFYSRSDIFGKETAQDIISYQDNIYKENKWLHGSHEPRDYAG